MGKKFDDYIQLDKEKYQNISDIKFSIDDQIISKIVKQSNEEFEKKKREKNKNKKSKNNINKKENTNKINDTFLIIKVIKLKIKKW